MTAWLVALPARAFDGEVAVFTLAIFTFIASLAAVAVLSTVRETGRAGRGAAFLSVGVALAMLILLATIAFRVFARVVHS